MSLGWTLNLFLLDECTRHDSSCVIECIARTLEDVKRISETTGRCMPSTVFVCSDNTPREAKKTIYVILLGGPHKQKPLQVHRPFEPAKKPQPRPSGSIVGNSRQENF